MRRGILRLSRRLFSEQPKTPTEKTEQAVKLGKFDVFDYAGHKFSYESKKSYGKYDIQQLWGDRVIFANDKATLKAKRKDSLLAIFIFSVFLCTAYYKYQIDKQMLDITEERLAKMYPNYDK